ncbi:MAG: hypothetical protein RSD36_00785 [Terrisporobacter sp.]
MLRKNKGSILIMSLIVFTIVTVICVTCSGLILSNNRMCKLDYVNEKIKLGNIGLIEIIHSNMLKEVKYAVENTKEEAEFYNYITKNSSRDFINKIKIVDGSNLDKSDIKIDYKTTISNKEFMHYTISTKYIVDNYDKYIVAKVKIKNPWYGKIGKEEIITEEDNVRDIIGKNQEEITSQESNEVDEEIKDTSKINESDLVIFYNYEEK